MLLSTAFFYIGYFLISIYRLFSSLKINLYKISRVCKFIQSHSFLRNKVLQDENKARWFQKLDKKRSFGKANSTLSEIYCEL